MKGTWSGGAPLLGTAKDTLRKGLEMGVCFHRGPAFGEHRGTHLLAKGKIFLFREIL